jgi:hypothetical protein
MSSKERFLYIAIVFFGAYYLINMYSSNEEEYINEYNSKIEALESKINSLHNINEEPIKPQPIIKIFFIIN